MGKLLKDLVLIAVLASGASAALAQKSTEMFVPIGQSPGLSGKHTVLANIQALNATDLSMTVTDAAGASITVRPDPQTRVWLDRNKFKQPTRKADFADLRTGMAVELKYRNNDSQAGAVEWIKAQATE